MQYEQQVISDRPVAEVFAYMDDVSRESEWQPNIVEAYQEPAGRTAVGTRKRYLSEFMGRRIENTYVTTAFEPNERVVYETTPDSALRAKVELRWRSVPSGTEVTMTFAGKVTGALRLIPGRLLERAYRNELETALGLLKERLEG